MLNTPQASTLGRCSGPQASPNSPWGAHAHGAPGATRHRCTSCKPPTELLWKCSRWSSQNTAHVPAIGLDIVVRGRGSFRVAANNGSGPNGKDGATNGQQRRASSSGRGTGDGRRPEQPATGGNLRNLFQKVGKVSGEMASDWQQVPPSKAQQQQQAVTPPGSSQRDRLRNLMQNFGMAGLPGMGMGIATEVATQQQQQQEAAAAQMASSGGLGAAAAAGPPRRRKLTAAEVTEWGSDWTEDWDPEEDLDEEARSTLADEAEAQQRASRGRGPFGTPRDKWITPLLDLRAVTGAVDPDQERTEDNLQSEALANKDESQTAIRYAAQLFLIPLITGFVLSRSLADPVLSFTLQNNSDAFAMTDRQKIEGAEKVHIEEARLRFDMAIGKLPPLSEEQILEHLREFAEEVVQEERLTNEQNLITVVSDSISSIVLFMLISQSSRGRQALFNTISRLFEGLSDIAKAVMIILIADTLLGYHSEEGWTGLIELVVGHYGFEAEEEGLVIFVGIVPVVIDVFFKYWIFIGLNRISPGAVITLKQIDTH